MKLLSQDGLILINPDYIPLKIIYASDLEDYDDVWSIDDSIYPWLIVAMMDAENAEIMGRFSTKEVAKEILRAIHSVKIDSIIPKAR